MSFRCTDPGRPAACFLALALASVHPPARAQPAPEPAIDVSVAPSSEHGASAPGGNVSIWYRTSSGCPDGASFVARLLELGRGAALANVGDRVDFVVSLAAGPESSAGRLERQTERGTVAIRELSAPRCEDVAEALALSLELALQPTSEASMSAPPPTATSPIVTAPIADPPAESGSTPTPTALLGTVDQAQPAARAKGNERPLRLGAQARLATGLAPSVAFGGALFAELGGNASEGVARLSVHGAYTHSTLGVEGRELDVGVLAGRLDGCAFGFDMGALGLQPCVGLDLGVLRASSSSEAGRTDQGLWAGAVGLVRSSLHLWPSVTPELQVGAALPFVRYVLGSPGGEDWFRTEPVAIEIAVGARWSP